MGEAFIAAIPSIRTTALENRKFLGRAVRYLTDEAKLRQFLDIGTGIPTEGNVHEVAQSGAAEGASSTWTTIRSCSRGPSW